jgi:hypothetical protein
MKWFAWSMDERYFYIQIARESMQRQFAVVREEEAIFDRVLEILMTHGFQERPLEVGST